MKHRNSVLLMLALAAVTANAQSHDYLPIVREGVEWGYVTEYHKPKEVLSRSCHRLQFLGDSVVNNVTYKKLYFYKTNKIEAKPENLYALMREDDGKVYLYMGENNEWYTKANLLWVFYGLQNQEFMLYDFKAAKGDVFCHIDETYNNPSDNTPTTIVNEMKVTGIENIESCGINRNAFSVKVTEGVLLSPNSDAKFIEGIGPVEWDMGGYYSRVGDVAYPYVDELASTQWHELILLYQRDLDGRMLYKSPQYDNYFFYDTTIAGIDDIRDDGGESLSVKNINGLAVEVESDGIVEAFNLQGIKVASAAGGVIALPAPGIYLLHAPEGTCRVVVK